MELAWFYVGDAVGGNQEEFSDPLMRMGGCAAICACDCAIWFALHRDRPHLYDGADQRITVEEYQRFGAVMKPYLRPRAGGVDRLEYFIEGFGQYLADHGETDIRMTDVPGDAPAAEALLTAERQLKRGLPVPFLLLRHRDQALDDLTWHWFSLLGMRREGENTLVKTITCGETYWVDFDRLWDTGHDRRGGMILFDGI
ncbi:MAG: hypothetical protein IJ240_06220 [Clostridia bacterium]|nr:hypothetical protein [Clostridia bacterium]